jgi:hypothetical protein
VDSDSGRHGVQPGQIFLSQLQLGSGEVLVQPLESAGARNGDDPWPLGQQPREGDLRWGSVLPDDVPDGAGHVLDRDGGVDAVLVEQVDAVGAQPAQRRVDHLPDVLRAAVEAAPLPGTRVDIEAELRRDYDVVAEGFERLADEFLVGERP